MTKTCTDPINDSPASVDGDDDGAHSPSLGGGVPKVLSKSAMKKIVRAERYAVSKLERRAREKEAKKEKKRINAEKRAAGELDEDNNNRRKKRARLQFGGKVVVDLDFDKMMSEKVGTKIYGSSDAMTSRGNRKSHLYVPNWRTPIVQTAMRVIHSHFYSRL
jgi:tRNA (guanine9-N1)-methyltransferase